MFDPSYESSSFDPQFLTFRHNNPEKILPSGRSIYSHRFDHPNLQKYTFFDPYNSERKDFRQLAKGKLKQRVKQVQLRAVRSQEKFRDVVLDQDGSKSRNDDSESDYKVDEKCLCSNRANFQLRRQSKNYKQTKQIRQKCRKNDGENSEIVLEIKEQLKFKLDRLVSLLKKEKMKQAELDQELQKYQSQIQYYDQQIQEQDSSINELEQINSENVEECRRIVEHIRKVSSKNELILSNLENIQESFDSQQISIETTRQDEAKDKALSSRLKQKFNSLVKMRNSLDTKILSLEDSIEILQYEVEQIKTQESQISRMLMGSQRSWSNSNNSSWSKECIGYY